MLKGWQAANMYFNNNNNVSDLIEKQSACVVNFVIYPHGL